MNTVNPLRIPNTRNSSEKNFKDATIAAIATPEGAGGLAVIRISGSKAFESALKIFRPARAERKRFYPWRMQSGYVVHPVDGHEIDEVLAVFFRKPRSYTGEDIVELSCHGNPEITREIMAALLSIGIRLAEPGEFTRRAFENNRIDLSRAEAVALMTTSESEGARRAALRVLRGGLAGPVQSARQLLLELHAAFEIDLDFPEEGASVPEDNVIALFDEMEHILDNLIDAGNAGDQLNRGYHIVISGNVNAGKSSVFNQLTGRERAIVSSEAGTTRDTLETSAAWCGCRFTLVDTAGIRETDSIAEKEAVRRTWSALEIADLIIFVIDSTAPELHTLQDVRRAAGDTPLILFWNKTELLIPDDKEKTDQLTMDDEPVAILKGSAKHGNGISELRKAVSHYTLSTGENDVETALMMTLRQKNALIQSKNLLNEARLLHQSKVGMECIVPLLRAADHELGTILGDTISQDVLGQIFARFCIGK